MIDFATLLQADRGQPATPLHLIDKSSFDEWLKGQSDRVRAMVKAHGFTGEANQLAFLPGERNDWSAMIGVSDRAKVTVWCLAKAAEALPEGAYRLADASPGAAALGWLLGQYRFDRFKKEPKTKGPRVLLTAEPARISELVRIAEATALVRDLVNVPAGDLGPAELQEAAEAVAKQGGATLQVTSGEKLGAEYPMIQAVGAAATQHRAPRLIEFEWGQPDHPRVAIIGKGVCFDTGGLDIKPSSGMRLMKKDMGGAAHALALAQLIMRQSPARAAAPAGAGGGKCRVRGSYASRGRAAQPQGAQRRDRQHRRRGPPDPGRRADPRRRGSARAHPRLRDPDRRCPGRARAPDLPALFANDDALAKRPARRLAAPVGDPLWRMPLWQPYEELFASDIADFSNAGDTPFAARSPPALFLQKFVKPETLGRISTRSRGVRAPKPGDRRAAMRSGCAPLGPC
jgi:leucyl aminopeptidase